MAKDPRFNFYPDNWTGGTKRMSFEQKGAYMELLLLNFYCLSDGLEGFTEQEALKTLGNAAAYAELWSYLMPKFMRKGDLFFSERMNKEFEKSKISSEKQSDRAKKRWDKNNPAYAAAYANNGNGNGIENSNEVGKGVQGENQEPSVYETFKKYITTPGQAREFRCITISRNIKGLTREEIEKRHDDFADGFIAHIGGAKKWEGTQWAEDYFMNWVNKQIEKEKASEKKIGLTHPSKLQPATNLTVEQFGKFKP